MTYLQAFSNQNICLRDQIHRPLGLGTKFQLSFISDFKLPLCTLGRVRFKSKLCYEDLRGVLWHYMCDNTSNTLVWTSDVTSEITYSSSKVVLIQLPGKVVDAQLNTVPNDCCNYDSCSLKYAVNRGGSRISHWGVPALVGGGTNF